MHFICRCAASAYISWCHSLLPQSLPLPHRIRQLVPGIASGVSTIVITPAMLPVCSSHCYVARVSISPLPSSVGHHIASQPLCARPRSYSPVCPRHCHSRQWHGVACLSIRRHAECAVGAGASISSLPSSVAAYRIRRPPTARAHSPSRLRHCPWRQYHCGSTLILCDYVWPRLVCERIHVVTVVLRRAPRLVPACVSIALQSRYSP